MCQDIGSACEYAVIDLQNVMAGTCGVEIGDDIVAEATIGEHEGIGSTSAREGIVTWRAVDRVVTAGAINRRTALPDVTSHIRRGGREAVHVRLR